MGNILGFEIKENIVSCIHVNAFLSCKFILPISPIYPIKDDKYLSSSFPSEEAMLIRSRQI